MALSVHGFLYAEGTLETQLALACVWGVIWFLTIGQAGKKIFQPWISSKTWKQRWIHMTNKTISKTFGIHLGSDELWFEAGCDLLAVICQHAIGGLLCLPSVLGFEGPAVWALACHGALSEAGWELQDVLKRSYEKVLGTEKQKKMNPTPLLVITGLHHAMGLGMVIPMNMLYGNNVYYHELVCLLQLAAFVALTAQNYGYVLDVKTSTGLRQMQTCVSISFVMKLWSRVIRYVWVGYKLVFTFYADGQMGMLCGGGAVLFLMGLVNFLIIAKSWSEFSKFITMKREEEAVTEAIADAHGTPCRQHSNSKIRLCTGKSRWSRLRGFVQKGLMREAKKQR